MVDRSMKFTIKARKGLKGIVICKVSRAFSVEVANRFFRIVKALK
jgi:hypothetical protein